MKMIPPPSPSPRHPPRLNWKGFLRDSLPFRATDSRYDRQNSSKRRCKLSRRDTVFKREREREREGEKKIVITNEGSGEESQLKNGSKEQERKTKGWKKRGGGRKKWFPTNAAFWPFKSRAIGRVEEHWKSRRKERERGKLLCHVSCFQRANIDSKWRSLPPPRSATPTPPPSSFQTSNPFKSRNIWFVALSVSLDCPWLPPIAPDCPRLRPIAPGCARLAVAALLSPLLAARPPQLPPVGFPAAGRRCFD